MDLKACTDCPPNNSSSNCGQPKRKVLLQLQLVLNLKEKSGPGLKVLGKSVGLCKTIWVIPRGWVQKCDVKVKNSKCSLSITSCAVSISVSLSF